MWPLEVAFGVEAVGYLGRGGQSSSVERHRLFREATQLKTVTAVISVIGIEVRRAKTQEHPIDAARGRRPTESTIADTLLPPVSSFAEARGGDQTNKKCRRKSRQKQKSVRKERYSVFSCCCSTTAGSSVSENDAGTSSIGNRLIRLPIAKTAVRP